MKLTVKTLKGGKFEVEVDDALTVEQVKDAIVRKKYRCSSVQILLIYS